MRAAAAGEALLLLSCAVFAQSAANSPSFDVASIKPCEHPVGRDSNNHVSYGSSGFTGRNVTLKRLITEAYRVLPYQVSGGPNWLDVSEYDVDARTDRPATREQLAAMLQTMLAERFKLALHSEARDLRVYELVVGKLGPKISPVKDPDSPAAKSTGLGWPFRGDMQQLANVISVQLTIPVVNDPGRPGIAGGALVPVLDKTGLPGVYDINVDIKPEAGGDMFTLWQEFLQNRLGLKLDSRKAQVKVFVVDSVERVPTAN